MKCSIIIPIYSESLLELELISLKQCCEMLINYQIIIITYKTLDITEYVRIFQNYKVNYKVEYFHKRYFSGISGYNALMFSNEFYKRFLYYEYILIYQLDAYVFSSELNYWLEQDYDYIGAPNFKEIRHTLELELVENLNGGFSLRKTSVFYHLSFTKTIKINKFYNEISQKITGCHLFFIEILLSILRKIIFVIAKIIKIKIVCEDNIWTNLIKRKGKIPPFETALNFSFDNFPEYAFGLNNGKLPFGCHNWDSLFYYSFWEKYIKHNKSVRLRINT
jgi:hypothetical protein